MVELLVLGIIWYVFVAVAVYGLLDVGEAPGDIKWWVVPLWPLGLFLLGVVIARVGFFSARGEK